MEKLTTLTGVAVPLRRSNVDTDQIIPAVFLKRVKKSGFDDALFYAWRRDPEFVLNKPEYKQGKILVAGPDFGIGSSREHAVWALHDYGFRVVISSRFADIFYGNTAKNGVLAAIMPQESIELLWKLLDEEPGREMTVSLEDRTVTCGDVTLPFEVNDYTRWRLMNGYDDIDLTLQHEDDIIAYEKMRAESSRSSRRPCRSSASRNSRSNPPVRVNTLIGKARWPIAASSDAMAGRQCSALPTGPCPSPKRGQQ